MSVNHRKLRCVVTALLLLVSLAGAQASSAPLQLLVPAYFYPGGAELADWDRMTAAAAEVALGVIINPATGPGSTVDGNYTTAITRLAHAGASLYGYINSDYGNRPLDAMRKDVDDYLSLYPAVASGFFLDLVPNAGGAAELDTYRAIYDYIKSKGSALRVIGNPGVNASEAYFTHSAFDTLVTFENYASNYANFVADAYVAHYSADHFAHLLHDQPSPAAMRAEISLAVTRGAGFVFVSDVTQSDLHPNAYDRLPSYWDAEVAAVRATAVPLPTSALYLPAALALLALRRRGAR
jgi:hypothetical protein